MNQFIWLRDGTETGSVSYMEAESKCIEEKQKDKLNKADCVGERLGQRKNDCDIGGIFYAFFSPLS